MKYIKEYSRYFGTGIVSLLKENVKQAESILKKIGKTKYDPEYKQIFDLVGDNKSYVGLFTDYYFNQNVSISDLESLINFLLFMLL